MHGASACCLRLERLLALHWAPPGQRWLWASRAPAASPPAGSSPGAACTPPVAGNSLPPLRPTDFTADQWKITGPISLWVRTPGTPPTATWAVRLHLGFRAPAGRRVKAKRSAGPAYLRTALSAGQQKRISPVGRDLQAWPVVRVRRWRERHPITPRARAPMHARKYAHSRTLTTRGPVGQICRFTWAPPGRCLVLCCHLLAGMGHCSTAGAGRTPQFICPTVK